LPQKRASDTFLAANHLSHAQGTMLKRYTHLTYDDRCQIYALKKSGILQNEIAVFLNVSQSTISRELRRNRGLRGYRHKQANDLAKIRGSAVGRLRHVLVPDLIIRVEACLVQKQWSPQQIAHIPVSLKDTGTSACEAGEARMQGLFKQNSYHEPSFMIGMV